MSSKIIIGVGIAGYPVAAAGNTWAFLQWALGFRSLGWEVLLVESIDSKKCVDSKWKSVPFDESANKSHWENIVCDYGFKEQCILLVDGESKDRKRLLDFATGCDYFLNISGHFKEREVIDRCRHRIYLDLDPAFTQIWAEVYGEAMNFESHNHFFTVGPLFETGNVRAPMAGKKWLGTLPLVHLPSWPMQPLGGDRYTTMTHWYGYPPVEYQGQWYGNKSEEFEKMIRLAHWSGVPLEIASDLGDEAELKVQFESQGWKMTRAAAANRDLLSYQRYIQSSRGEFSVAKSGYVLSKCGWFSDRSVCYLASGKPVILQETGWSELIPSGKGALAFQSIEEAQEQLTQVELDPQGHSLAARSIAENYLDSAKVISELIRKVEKSL